MSSSRVKSYESFYWSIIKKADVPIDTIRYYEKVGVLDRIQRSENNYRVYTDQTLADLLFIKHCRELDISLSDIKTLKEMKAQPKRACTEVGR